MLKIINGQVYDPANGVSGDVKDIYLKDGHIVEGPSRLQESERDIEVLDATGLCSDARWGRDS